MSISSVSGSWSTLCFQLELKETGHTPELTSKQDGKAVPLKKEVLTSRRPPVQRSSSQEKELRSLNTVSKYGSNPPVTAAGRLITAAPPPPPPHPLPSPPPLTPSVPPALCWRFSIRYTLYTPASILLLWRLRPRLLQQ